MTALATFNAGFMAIVHSLPIHTARYVVHGVIAPYRATHHNPLSIPRQARIKELCVFVFYVLVGVPNAVLHCRWVLVLLLHAPLQISSTVPSCPRYCLYQMSNASWTRPQAPASSLEGWQLMVVLLMLLFFSASRYDGYWCMIDKGWAKCATLRHTGE